MRRPIQVGLKLDSFLCHLSELLVTKDLIPSAVRQNGSLPRHEPVKPALTMNGLGTRAQVQVIGVGQDDCGLEFLQKLMRHGLDRTGGADRHENRGLNLSMCGCEDPLTSMGLLVSSLDLKELLHN